MKSYLIKVWETEAERETGESDIIESNILNIDEAIKKAKKIMKKNNFASIEVQDNKQQNTLYFATEREEMYFKTRQEIQNIEDIVNDYFEEYGITNLDDYGEDIDSHNMPTLSQLYEDILDEIGIDYYHISTESVSDGKYTTNIEFENGNSINIDTNSSNTSKEITDNVKTIKKYSLEQENEETDDMEM